MNRPCALLRTCPLHTVHHLLGLGQEILKHGGRAGNGNGYRLAFHVQEGHAFLGILRREDVVFERRDAFYSADVNAVRPASPSVVLRWVPYDHVDPFALDSSYLNLAGKSKSILLQRSGPGLSLG